MFNSYDQPWDSQRYTYKLGEDGTRDRGLCQIRFDLILLSPRSLSQI